jgi:hypothetical protein
MCGAFGDIAHMTPRRQVLEDGCGADGKRRIEQRKDARFYMFFLTQWQIVLTIISPMLNYGFDIHFFLVIG